MAKGKLNNLETIGFCNWTTLLTRCSLVHILALGVFWTGFIKDFYSLPRPLSPPLHRITMSGSAALEYGFPSTHSANAVSVAVYGLLLLKSPENTLPPTMKFFLECLSYFYAASIVFGRLYCGMHGFLDVIVGSVIGTAIGMLEFYYGPAFDAYMHSSSWVAPVLACLIIVILVRIHPEPADDCPCFDDSVAFAGVVIGLEFGSWTYGKIPWDPWVSNAYAGNGTVDVTPLGWGLNIVRIVFGVLIVFAWRETMKPLLLKGLPHLFRLIESCGFTLPRRFFTPASEYKSVPPGSRIDTLFPTASDFPRMVAGIRHPTTRGRSVSIGPQSAADAYETLAYRERQRRESISSNHSLKSKSSNLDLLGKSDDQSGRAQTSGAQKPSTSQYEKIIAGNEAVLSAGDEAAEQQSRKVDEKEVFALLVKPRVRYDVEVVTKLIVYTGEFDLDLHVSSPLEQLMLICCRNRMVCSRIDSHYFRVGWIGDEPSGCSLITAVSSMEWNKEHIFPAHLILCGTYVMDYGVMMMDIE